MGWVPFAWTIERIEAATYPLGTRSAELRVELPEDELSADFLERMQLRSRRGNMSRWPILSASN